MADLQPLRTLRYDTSVAGSLEDVIAPPYDVIDDALRAELAARSPFNVVEIDLPPSDAQAAATHGGLARAGRARPARTTRPSGCCARTTRPPTGASATRTGFFGRVRVDEYGAGRIRPHERTHPAPKEDRLRLTRATRTNLSPIFSALPRLRPRPPSERSAQLAARRALRRRRTASTLWRSADPDLIAELQMALADAELLIADGHHRYETARDLRRRDRRRGRPPLRADAALLAVRPRPADLPDPPPAHRPQGRPRQAGRDPRRARHAISRSRRSAQRRSSSRRRRPTAGSPSATWTPSTRSPTG